MSENKQHSTLKHIQYYFDEARVIAARSKCKRLHVGCVLIRDDRIITKGFNGQIRAQPDCPEIGCNKDEPCGAIHAEVNAVLNAAYFGVSTNGSIAICTHKPCLICERFLKQAGIVATFYIEEYEGASDKLPVHKL